MSTELILGGARSGKSRLAEQRATAHGGPVTVIATAEAGDEEMAARIARHRADRPAHWSVVEAPVALAAAVRLAAHGDGCVIVDCLTLWLSNLLTRDAASLAAPHSVDHMAAWQAEVDALVAALPGLPGHVILVANEVGLGLVPESPLGRLFRDEAGRLNQTVAAACDTVTFVAAGLPLTLKGTPA
ncbi:bifunctional adenosylcobinamide kinase/adenosylcobinamide-phosphate guanylyltransferase [Nitrogeniibacter mangrovi]|uniref:Bifunctional adenosylcobalamin biosynthesis protein n=1 Tax=Nitrogeniibacter mangrovi TaxID=2016596 RepID=A0A6C1AZ90_9RHOO|nr:bifunctional adenosylcobinamide kinase/adenosylcobinamide-phosphate guanylyltransferase [Nitrogeniibacter mangrovi]QID16672.1 bifunctional adenosylcobinamide kinase/adenosylcobinamide-phosphate guanylyltransferase [Nitrogeniibacter mangrovi]